MASNQTPPARRAAISDWDDPTRAKVIALANFLGLIATAVIFYAAWFYHREPVWSLSDLYMQLLACHVLLIAVVTLLLWPMYLIQAAAIAFVLLWHLIGVLRRKSPTSLFPYWLRSRRGPKKFRPLLWMLVLCNFIYMFRLIVVTGGIVASPFTSYAVVMVTLGQFIANPGGFIRWLLFFCGFGFFVALLLWGPMASDPEHVAAAKAITLVMGIALFISTLITTAESQGNGTSDAANSQLLQEQSNS